MTHKNYHEITADSYYELGLKEGVLFSLQLTDAISAMKQYNKKRADAYLTITNNAFPHLIEELRGYAEGAGVAFEDLWALSLEDELFPTNRCTSVITNNGALIAHNEDWEVDAKEDICILKKSLPHITIFELFYYNTLGGNAIAINSNGSIQTINTLTHTDSNTVGIPRNIVARWLSESSNPIKDFATLSSLKRSAGYSHSFINLQGTICTIEASAKKQHFVNVNAPFVHTNHYLFNLQHLEDDDNECGTFDRFDFASKHLKSSASLDQLKNLMSDTSKGKKVSLFNERTIARMIVDVENMTSSVWLLREATKGWVDYRLDFMV